MSAPYNGLNVNSDVIAYNALSLDKEREEEKEREKEMMGRKQHIRKIAEDLDSNRSVAVIIILSCYVSIL